MNTNQNNTHPSFTASVINNNNLENMASSWPTTHPISSTSSSSSGFLISDMFGFKLKREGEDQEGEEEEEELGAMKEMMYKIAALRPVDIDPSTIRKPKRRNVRISDDPQSVAARHRRERISEKIRILQRLVPGGTKLDTASMLDEAIRYVKFLKRQIRSLQSPPPPQQHCNNIGSSTITTTANITIATLSDWPYYTPASTSTSTSTLATARLGFNGGGDS